MPLVCLWIARNSRYSSSYIGRVAGSGANVSTIFDAAGDVVERGLAERERGERGRAARVGADRVLDLADRPVEHVGHDPAPQPRLRSPADEVERRERLAGELLDAPEQPAAVVGDAFEHRTHEVGARRLQREVVPAAAQAVIVDRRALAVEPRREDHAVAPGRRGRRQRRRAAGRSRRARGAARSASSGKNTLSRSQLRLAPATSCSSAT